MNPTRPFRALSLLCVVCGALGLWLAFQRQMCDAVGGVENSCSPNIAYLIPGMGSVLFGVVLFLYGRRRRDRSSGV